MGLKPDASVAMQPGATAAALVKAGTQERVDVDNCQLGVFLAFTSPRGRALVDRELYLPVSWTEDPDRCARAGVPADVGFATTPQQAVAMLTRAHDAGMLYGWATADEVYGQNPAFRAWLATREVPFVLATRSDDVLTSPRRAPPAGPQPRRDDPRPGVGTSQCRSRRTRRTALRLGRRGPGHHLED